MVEVFFNFIAYFFIGMWFVVKYAAILLYKIISFPFKLAKKRKEAKKAKAIQEAAEKKAEEERIRQKVERENRIRSIVLKCEKDYFSDGRLVNFICQFQNVRRIEVKCNCIEVFHSCGVGRWVYLDHGTDNFDYNFVSSNSEDLQSIDICIFANLLNNKFGNQYQVKNFINDIRNYENYYTYHIHTVSLIRED